MQVCHGKAAPLRRTQAGDRIAYYSPTRVFGGKEKCQAFTALGVVRSNDPYQVAMGRGFRPFRHDVAWFATHDAAIAPLLPQLDFAAGKRNWSYQLRFGLFAMSDRDMDVIATALGVMPTNKKGAA